VKTCTIAGVNLRSLGVVELGWTPNLASDLVLQAWSLGSEMLNELYQMLPC